jgi:hypothetical protein
MKKPRRNDSTAACSSRRCCAACRTWCRTSVVARRRNLRSAGLLLVALLRDRCLDPPSAQVGPDRSVRVGLVGQQPPRAGPRPPTSEPADPQAIHQRFERNRVVALPGGSDPGQWPAPGVAQQVNLRGQPTAGAPQRLSVSPLGPRGRGTLVIRPSPLCRLWTRPGTRLRSRLGPPAAGRDVFGRRMARAGSVLMRPDRRRIGPDSPLRALVHVTSSA